MFGWNRRGDPTAAFFRKVERRRNIRLYGFAECLTSYCHAEHSFPVLALQRGDSSDKMEKSLEIVGLVA